MKTPFLILNMHLRAGSLLDPKHAPTGRIAPTHGFRRDAIHRTQWPDSSVKNENTVWDAILEHCKNTVLDGVLVHASNNGPMLITFKIF
jgi:hypothetical protein